MKSCVQKIALFGALAMSTEAALAVQVTEHLDLGGAIRAR